MQKLNYDVNYAIGIRGKTFEEIGLGYENPNLKHHLISFKDSVCLAQMDLDQPNPPYWWEVIGHRLSGQFDRSLANAKKEWYRFQHDLRQYYYDIAHDEYYS